MPPKSPPQLYLHPTDPSALLGSFLNPYPPPSTSNTPPAFEQARHAPIDDIVTYEDLDIEALSLSDDDSEPLRLEAWDRPHGLEKNLIPKFSSPKRRVSFSDHIRIHEEQPWKERRNSSANNGRVWQKIPGGWVADDGEEEEKEEDAAYTDLLDHPWSFPYSKGYSNSRWRGSPFGIGMDGVDESVVCLRFVYFTILHTWMCPFDYSMSVTHFTGRTVS